MSAPIHLSDLLRDALVSAALASLTATGLAVELARRRGHKPPAVPNAVAHMAEGPKAAGRQDWSPHTAEGVMLNFAGCLAWSAVAEAWARLRPCRSPARALGRGAILAAMAYAVDQHVLPGRWRPAYDVVLTLPARLTVYASLAATLPLRPLMRQWMVRRAWQRPAGRLISARLMTAGACRRDAKVNRR
jgi:hypothetical protein